MSGSVRAIEDLQQERCADVDEPWAPEAEFEEMCEPCGVDPELADNL